MQVNLHTRFHENKSAMAAALGGDAAAVAKVRDLPQIESDDYGLLTGLLSEPEFVVGGMRETFAEVLADGSVKEIPLRTPLSWNICAARKADNHSAALDLLWSTLAEMNA